MPLFSDSCGPTRECRHCQSAGPFKLINRTTRRWLWAHSGISTSLLDGGCGPISECRHCHSVGPFRNIDIIIRRQLLAHLRTSTVLLGGPIQDYRHQHLATAVGPHVNGDIATRWAHSGISTSLFGDGCGPTHECRHCQSAGSDVPARPGLEAMALARLFTAPAL